VQTIKYINIKDNEQVAKEVAARLRIVAKSKNILLLIPGGSAIELAIRVLALSTDLKNKLTVSLTDERFGEPGHVHSNWQQLKASGFEPEKWHCYPVLSGKDVNTTTRDFHDFLERQINKHNYISGIFGMGADGHTAGILPKSSAVGSSELASHYNGPDYERITVTPKFLKHLDEAFLYAVGETKHEQLNKLSNSTPVQKQPAQILKQAKLLTVISDYRGNL